MNIGLQLQKVQALSFKVTRARKKIIYYKGIIENDPLQALKLMAAPSKNKGPPQSQVEITVDKHEDASAAIEKLNDYSRLIGIQIKKELDEIQFYMRRAEFDLLTDFFVNRLSRDNMIQKYGSSWERKLRKTLKDYGGM